MKKFMMHVLFIVFTRFGNFVRYPAKGKRRGDWMPFAPKGYRIGGERETAGAGLQFSDEY